MKEEGDLDVLLGLANLLAKHGGQKHQVVVVNPYEVTVLDIFGNSLSKQTVGLLVGIPSGLIKGNFTRMIVE